MTEQENIATLIARLRKEESRCASVYIIDAAIETIERLVNERDEARRMYCSVVENSRPHGTSAEDVAKSIGWNCYKKEETQ